MRLIGRLFPLCLLQIYGKQFLLEKKILLFFLLAYKLSINLISKAINKKSVENKTNIYSYMEATILDSLQSLRNELSSKHYKGQLDPFSLYVLVFIENFIHLIIRKERERE